MKLDHFSDQWYSIAKDVIEAAKNGWSVEEYKRACMLHAPRLGKDYYYRKDILDRMLYEGLVSIQDEHLRLGSIKYASWLQTQLTNGSGLAWEFVTEIYGDIEDAIFDAQILKEIGLEGELFVLEAYRRELPPGLESRIAHVSARDDTKGYDIIAPSVIKSDHMCHVEVKTSVRPGNDFIFFLSRNEYEVACRDRNWALILVSKTEGSYKLLGRLYSEHIQNIVPIDKDDTAMWASVRIRKNRSDFIQGLA